jgi:stress response protein YsnF/sporulation protein YlmC with PRC-barrel domain
MASFNQLMELKGKTIYDRDGEKIGKMEDIYLDNESQEPEWFSVGSGFFGTKHQVIPIQGYSMREDGLQVPYSKDLIKDSPSVDSDEIEPDREMQLYEYYGLQRQNYREPTQSYDPSLARPADDDMRRRMADRNLHPSDDSSRPGGDTGIAARDAIAQGDRNEDRGEIGYRSSAGHDGDGNSMVRHEEQLRVGTREGEAGRARLRKWVETQPVSEDVQLRRETARIEREPINQTVSNADIGEREVEMKLRREEPVVEKETVARERVSLEKEMDQRTERVTGDVAREHIEVDGDMDRSSLEGGRGRQS